MRRLAAAAAAIALSLAGSGAAAQASGEAQATPAGAEAPAFGTEALGDSALGRVSGRQGADQYAEANETGVVSNNSVNGSSVTGAVQIDGAAFQNLQGLSVINANTGNNVAINAAMNVNISLSPQN